MLFDLGNLSNGMGKIFIREFMKSAYHMFCNADLVLFREGEATHHFYTLIEGGFLLTIKNNKQQVYTVCHSGDVFGWSSLVGRTQYSATALSTMPSEILRFDNEVLINLLDRHPDSGLLFFKKLAETLGKRLLESYLVISGDKTLDCFSS
jgi:CRP-like cAMP-binding protein